MGVLCGFNQVQQFVVTDMTVYCISSSYLCLLGKQATCKGAMQATVWYGTVPVQDTESNLASYYWFKFTPINTFSVNHR